MLKKIQVTYTIDPKDFALLLAHAGQVSVNFLTDTPVMVKPKGQKLLPAPAPKNAHKDSQGLILGAFDAEGRATAMHLTKTLNDAGRPSKTAIYAALQRLIKAGLVKRTGTGKYQLTAKGKARG